MFPNEWARTRHHLGICYQQRISGDHKGNIEQAIENFELALIVRPREVYPRDYLRTKTSLGETLLMKRDWSNAAAALADAREVFISLFGQGLDQADAWDLIEAAGPLFTAAAFAATELGKGTRALSLVSEGKARLMTTALRLETLALPTSRRARLKAIRAEINKQLRDLEGATPVHRAAILDNRLAQLREELSTLTTDARSPWLAKLSGNLLTLITGAGQAVEADAMACVRLLLVQGGAVVVPIVTAVGGKLLIVVRRRRRLSVRVVLELPKLNTKRLIALMHGGGEHGKVGWLATLAHDDVPWAERMKRIRAAVASVGVELWQLFAGQLSAVLHEHGVSPGARLIWLPTGALGLLPVGLAQDPETGKCLLDGYEIVYAPSLEIMVKAQRQAERAGPPSLAAIINPTGDLAFTPIEGALIANHFDATARTLLDDKTATPRAVLDALKDNSYWHFSTHLSITPKLRANRRL